VVALAEAVGGGESDSVAVGVLDDAEVGVFDGVVMVGVGVGVTGGGAVEESVFDAVGLPVGVVDVPVGVPVGVGELGGGLAALSGWHDWSAVAEAASSATTA
jgi:hypothetical protein